jgi:hypothetical protein
MKTASPWIAAHNDVIRAVIPRVIVAVRQRA